MIWVDWVLLLWAAVSSWLAVEGWQKFCAERQKWTEYISSQAKVWLADQQKLRRYRTALVEIDVTATTFVLNEEDDQARLDRIVALTVEALYPGGEG